MAIEDWPKGERPREKLLARGPAALSDSELLALFLGVGCNGLGAMQSAWRLIRDHGPLTQLLDLDATELQLLPGLGPARACKLVAAMELANRHLLAELDQGESIHEPRAAMRYFKQRLRGRSHEVFAVLFMDTRNRILAFDELFNGTVDAAAIYAPEVVRYALLRNASAVIVGQSRPSGSAEPSTADRQITRLLKNALPLVGIRLLDHVVVGEGTPVSMAERGWLEATRNYRS